MPIDIYVRICYIITIKRNNGQAKGREGKQEMFEIYINGESATWKRIANEYGKNYAEELKAEAKAAKPWTTIYSEDDMIEISVY